MSGGMSKIPNNVRKMIHNIKEITGNVTDDLEIYDVLQDCHMDADETAQKLLLQDTFHEVKRRRDRKKENQTSRDTADSQWRSGGPGRGGRGGRGSYTSRHADARGGKIIHAKENGVNQASSKFGSASSAPVQEAKKKDDGSSVTEILNGPVDGAAGGIRRANAPEILSGRDAQKLQPQLHSGGRKRSDMSGAIVESIKPATLSSIGSQASDPVLTPNNLYGVTAADSVKHDVESQHFFAEPGSNISPENKSNSGKVGGKSQGVGKNHSVELQNSSLGHGSSSLSLPSSNYGSRSQQALASQKGPNKEWKPKVTCRNNIQGQGVKMPAASEDSTVIVESAHTQSVESISDAERATDKCQKQLKGPHVRDARRVIIPNHIHVPEAVRTGLSFGSFGSAFISSNKFAETEMENSNSLSQTEQVIEETVEESSSEKMLAPGEEPEYVDHSPPPKQAESLSTGDVSVPASSVPDLHDLKETDSDSQNSSVQTSAGYNLGLLPPMLGNPLVPLETSETQARDASRVSSFIVQQPVDPSSFSTQFYRSGADSDGRSSPFAAHGIASKYSGNGSVLLSQTSQPSTEGINSLVLPTAAQTPHATQAAAVMPNSIAITQQPMPLFRQPGGIHIPHYPPNYFPYGHYFPPFYVPPPTMHQFLGNNAFPHQAQAGSVYPTQPAPAAGPAQVKFPMSQYKPAGSAGNSMHMGISGGYGPYGASPVGYNSVSAATAGNSTANEDLASSQFKENHLYITGQQSEGSAVWIPAPGCDITNLPNSFYNIAPQGQHVTFAPTPTGQGPFAGIYHPHPAQAVTAAAVHPLLQQSQPMPGAVDMVGTTANVYQQPQHAQINWPNTY